MTKGLERTQQGSGFLRAFCGALATLATLALAGCSGADSPTETVGSGSAQLAVPVTVTLKTPNSVPALAPVIAVSNSAFIGARAEIVQGALTAVGVSGGGVHTEPDALLNETWSKGVADLRDRTRVRGTLHAASQQLGFGVQITTLDKTPRFDPLTALSWTVRYPSATDGRDVRLNAGQSQSLAPGQYGNIALNSQATLTLKTGTYYLRTLDLESASVVKLDQSAGPVVIYVETGNLILRGSIASLDSQPPDLLITYLGSTAFLVETLFNGALIAPFATVTLRAVTGVHTGYFYAKDLQILDAGAKVQYRAPLPVITASAPGGYTCRQLVTALVPAADLPAALRRYCGACPSRDDTDLDKVPDCLDACPYDAAKTDPGMCGCGVPETDTDGDGTKDCKDRCPNDPNNTTPGQCGCAGPHAKQVGTPCTDTGCPLPNGATTSTCNGAGVCGDHNQCLPAASPICKYANRQGVSYWFCGTQTPGTPGSGQPPGQLTQADAAKACSAKGLTLLRVNSLLEERFIAPYISSPIWLGANDLTTVNNWRWSTPTSRDGDQFWAGSANGSPVGGRFSYWAPGAPGTQRCAALRPGDGRWVDTDCNQALGYVCVFAAPSGGGGDVPPPGIPAQPDPLTDCKPQTESMLTDSRPDLDYAYAEAAKKHFVGPAANPPPDGSVCKNDDPKTSAIGSDVPVPGGGCRTIETKSECTTTADCSAFGPNYVCRQTKDQRDCAPPAENPKVMTSAACRGHSRCVLLDCPQAEVPCGEIDICDPGTSFTTALDPGSALDAGNYDPAKIFGGALPSTTPASTYDDPPRFTGTDHSWCRMDAQHPISNATQPPSNYKGESGSSTKLKFDFDPDLQFDIKPNLLALGESNTLIHAKAKLGASVALQDFLKQDFSAPILDASIGVSVDRCSLDTTTDTKFTVFGLDLVSAEDLGIPMVNTKDPASTGFFPASLQCYQSMAKFSELADRAKKAFRDAQQLLEQYHRAKTDGFALASDLCTQIGVAAANVPFFPGGNNCPLNEPVEITINRFVDYYQAPGSGQVSGLRQAAKGLADATAALKSKLFDPQLLSLQFADTHGEESQTIVNAPFAIGPIPMVLQVDVFAQYGVSGNFDLSLDFPLSLETPVGEPLPVAHVGANVVPYAGTGLSAFVGAGVDLGVITATIGIEGAITLADLKAPIFAGAGFDVAVTNDLRPLPDDIKPPVALAANAFQFGIPKAFKFFVTYDYGAGIDVRNVLSGEINGRLRIKFAFFSRTWRKRIVKFDGWSKHFDLVKGSSNLPIGSIGSSSSSSRTVDSDTGTNRTTTQVADGQVAAGLQESQVPLMQLASLPVPDPAVDARPKRGFDASKVESMFYDSQCCLKTGDTCFPNATRPACCPGSRCVAPPPDPNYKPGDLQLDLGFCVDECSSLEADCKADDDCCQGQARAVICSSNRACELCKPSGQSCVNDHDCCAADGTKCDANTKTCKVPVTCAGDGESCSASKPCCDNKGLICNSTCQLVR